MKNIIEKCKNCDTKSNINIVTGFLLIIIGIIDFSRGDYAFAGSWTIFGLMYLVFETKFKILNLIGVYAGVFLCTLILSYYITTY